MAEYTQRVSVPFKIETRVQQVYDGGAGFEDWTWTVRSFGREVLRCRAVDGQLTERAALRDARKALREYAAEQMGA